MKLIVFSCFCLVFLFSFGQNGFDLIHRAEKQIEKGNYRKASKLLDKADSSCLGTCGLAITEGHEAIRFNRLKIRAEMRHDYINVANELNAGNFYFVEGIDSLKMSYFIKCLDKKILKREIDSCLEAIEELDSSNLEYDFALNVSFSNKPFKLSYYSGSAIFHEIYYLNSKDKEIAIIDRFRKAVKNQAFYKLLL